MERCIPQLESCPRQDYCWSIHRTAESRGGQSTAHGPPHGPAVLLIKGGTNLMYHAVSFSRVCRSVERPSLPPNMMPSQMSELPVILPLGRISKDGEG